MTAYILNNSSVGKIGYVVPPVYSITA